MERNTEWFIGALVTLSFVLTFLMGWIIAHSAISRECTKLGAFYVGNTVYECKVKQM